MTRLSAPPRRGGPPSLRPPGRPPRPAPAGETRRRPAAPTIDPRIAARRIAVRRDEGRRRLRRLLVVLAVAAVAGLALGLTRTPLLDVDNVVVRGTQRVEAAEVVAAVSEAGAGRGEPLLDVDAGAVERRLRALPAVAEADVSRDWPGTVVVEVVEREPVATAPAAGGARALVAADGVVVDVAGEPVALPALDGVAPVAGPGDVVDSRALLEVAAAVPRALRPAVAAVVPGAHDGELGLRLADGGTVRLGSGAELGAKLAALATMIERADLSCLAVLDVRVATAPTVTRQPECST